MKFHILLISATALFSTHSYSECDTTLDVAITEAAKIQNNSARLKKYDEIAHQYAGNHNSSLQPESQHSWLTNVTVSPIDDSITVLASIQSEAPIEVDCGISSPTLYLEHSSGRTRAYIQYNTFLGSDYITATTRIDKNDPIKRTWKIGTDNETVVLLGNIPVLLDNLFESDRFVVQINPQDCEPIVAIFSMNGFSDVLRSIEKANSR